MLQVFSLLQTKFSYLLKDCLKYQTFYLPQLGRIKQNQNLELGYFQQLWFLSFPKVFRFTVFHSSIILILLYQRQILQWEDRYL